MILLETFRVIVVTIVNGREPHAFIGRRIGLSAGIFLSVNNRARS